MNELEHFFRKEPHRRMDKWVHYFEIYEKHFSRYRGQRPIVIEIGVQHGGSLQMWKKYFGEYSKIIGIDIDPRCKFVEEPGIEIVRGDQGQEVFWEWFKKKYPRPTILIDDGGHTMKQQIITFKNMFDFIDENGVYLCEDLHCAYWSTTEHGGGPPGKPGTSIELFKGLVDELNGFQHTPTKFTESAYSMHFYPSVFVVEKRPMVKSHDEQIGEFSW